MSIHVFGVTDNDRLWHSILPTQSFFGDVLATGGTGHPWHTDDPATSPKATDSACAADSVGNLHVLVVSSDGRLWHTIRAVRDGTWLRFGNVEAGGAGNIGTITAVAAATEGTALHILAVNSAKELHRTVWNPPTSAGPARFDPPFQNVGTWKPARGLLRTVAAAKSPPQPEPVPRARSRPPDHPDRSRRPLLPRAVRRFQEASNLLSTGEMTGATWQAFLERWLSGQAIGP